MKRSDHVRWKDCCDGFDNALVVVVVVIVVVSCECTRGSISYCFGVLIGTRRFCASFSFFMFVFIGCCLVKGEKMSDDGTIREHGMD